MPNLNSNKAAQSDVDTILARIAGVYGSAFVSAGASNTVNLTFNGNAVFLILGLNRRSSGAPFAAVVQKYGNATNFAVLSGTAGNFNTSNTSAGMIVTMPDTYYDVLIIGTARVKASV